MSIAEFCNRSVMLVRRDHTVREVVAIMRESHGGAVVIVDDRRRSVGVSPIAMSR